jgi:Tfp pilus assembly protein PilX
MKPQTWKKKGAILVYVVLIMALLIVFGVGMIFLANHNTNTTANEVYAEQAYLTARSGLRSTMTLMEDDTAKTSAVASQLKISKTLASSVDLTANKLGTVNVQMSCADTGCTVLQIDSTGTYQGVSQTVTGYMKSSAPQISGSAMILNKINDIVNDFSKSTNLVSILGFDGKPIASTKLEVKSLPLGLTDYFQDVDFSKLANDSQYIVIDCKNAEGFYLSQYSDHLVVSATSAFTVGSKSYYSYTIQDSSKIIVLHNYVQSYVLLKPIESSNYQYKIFFADNGGTINLPGTFYSLNVWLVAPGSIAAIDAKVQKQPMTIVGGLVCAELSWRNGSKFTINGTNQNPIQNTAFMNLYNQLAGGGWTRSYEKP